MTTNTEFQRKLTQTANAAEKHFRLLEEVGKMFEERYGAHYSDVDCDSVIDALNQTGGKITVAEVDKAMALVGHPKLEK
jgi:uncharacterized ferritin-like protein (DUF455 family)